MAASAAAAPRRYLLTPGPTNTAASVRAAGAHGDVCHKELHFRELLISLRGRLVRLSGGDDAYDGVVLTCSGTGAVETMLNGLTGPALVLVNGRYSERMAAILERNRIPTHLVRFDPMRPLTPELLDKALTETSRVESVVCVHHETEFGVLNPLQELGAVAARHGKPLYVDAISSVGAHPLDLTSFGVAACAISSNKGLESMPGLSFVVARRRIFEAARDRSGSSYLDLYGHWDAQRTGAALFTPATNAIYAFDEALRILEDEGYDRRVARYASIASRLRASLASIGFTVLDAAERGGSNVVTVVRPPSAVEPRTLIAEAAHLGLVMHASDVHLERGTLPISLIGAVGDSDVEEVAGRLRTALGRSGYSP